MRVGWWWRLTMALLAWSVAACASHPRGAQKAPFVPPPLPATLPSAATPAAQPSAAQPTPACTNSLTYLEDLTIPDGTVVDPGATLDKQWRVRNSGTCNWDERYHLRLVDGDPLGAEEEVPLYPARAGAEAIVRIVFTAPQQPGTYISTWQAVDPQGNFFGDPIFIQIRVAAATPGR